MSGIKDYSTTQANNIDLNGIDTNEGMLPSNLNNAIRALMKNTREWFNDSEWVEYGDGDAAYISAWVSTTQFTIASSVDISAIYHVGRRLKVLKADASLVYGSITATSNNGTLQTITATFDSGNLGSSTNKLRIFIGILSKTNSSIPTEIIGTSNIANNAITTAKIADSQITVAKMTSNSVDSDQYVDGSIDLIHLSADSVDGTKIANDSINSEHYVDASIDSQHIADDQITTSKIPDSAITSAKIANGAIVDADINASAAISLSKLENLTNARALVSDGNGDVSVSAVTSTEVGYLDGVSSAIQTQIDAKQASDADLTAIGNLAKTDGNLIVGNGSTWVAESGATARTSLGLGSIATQAANNVSISGGSVTGLGEPSSNSDASTKSYVDQAVAGLRTRTIAECASTGNVNISNALEAGDAIDGVTLVAGDRVLLKNQSTASQNGLYIAVANGAGAASRDPEHDTIAELSGGMIVVNQGSVNDNKIFLCTTNSTGSVGSTAITYTVVTPANSGTVTSIATGTGIDGGTITSAGTISIDSTVATLAGTQTLTNKTLTSPKINENVAVTSTATELNLLDGKDATFLAVPGKIGGTNFTNSLLIGHATSGTLNDAHENVGIGTTALDALTSGDRNVAIGMYAGTNINQGADNTLVGHSTGGGITSTAKNTFIGASAGGSDVGHRNTALGHFSGNNLGNASGCVFIGSSVVADSTTDNRQLKIGGYDGSATTTWIKGDSSGNLVTPGTITANSVVLTGVAADDSITLAKMASGTDGNIISYDTSGNPVAVATGSSGQVLTSAGAGAVPSFQSPAGGGKIGQVLQAHKINQFTTTNGISGTGFTDITGISQAITPSATSSKVLIMANIYTSVTSVNSRVYFRIEKGGTAIGLPSAMGSGTAVFGSQYNWHTSTSTSMITLMYLDSPSTTSATTYNISTCINGGDGASTIRINHQSNSGNDPADDNGTSNITLMEVLA